MYSRQREVCFSSGRHATNLAETTDGMGWVDYFFFRLTVAIGMQHTTLMLIKKGFRTHKSTAAKLFLFMAG